MQRMLHRPEIDGLRAIAVLAVVLYHAIGTPAAGFVGVDVFFVISGYLITSLLLREHADTGRIDLIGFYARRVRRIFPAALVVVVAVLCAASLLLAPEDKSRTAWSAGASAVFGANFFFEAMTGGYFDPSAEQMPLLHLWSLAVEEQFYLFWPALLIVLLNWWPRRLVPIVAVIGIGSFVLAEALMMTVPQAAFYQMPARFWELAAGGLLAAMPERTKVPRWIPMVAVIGIVMSCAMPLARFPGTGALPVVAGTTALLWAVHRNGELGWAGAWLRSRPMVGVGLVSYSLYLWHWPLLAFYRATTIGPGSALVRIALCGVAMLLAIASYRYIETPFRRMRASRRVFAVGTACSIVLAVAACAYGLKVQADEAAMPHDDPLAVKAEGDLPPGWKRCHYQVWSTEFPRPGCETIAGRKPRIVLWGDSLAMTWRPLIEAMGKRAGQSAIDYSRDACGPFVGHLPANPLPGDYKCRDWNANVLEQARAADTVVLVARWHLGVVPKAGGFEVYGLRKTLLAIGPGVRRIIVIGATPELRDKVPHCIRMHAIERCAVPRQELDAIDSAVMANLHAAASGLANVEFVDPTAFFCNAAACPAIREGVPLYFDNYHIAYSAAKAYAERFVGGK